MGVGVHRHAPAGLPPAGWVDPRTGLDGREDTFPGQIYKGQ
jgi:hypothetical protein